MQSYSVGVCACVRARVCVCGMCVLRRGGGGRGVKSGAYFIAFTHWSLIKLREILPNRDTIEKQDQNWLLIAVPHDTDHVP